MTEPLLVPKYGIFAECPFCRREIYRAASEDFNKNRKGAIDAVEQHRKECPGLAALRSSKR